MKRLVCTTFFLMVCVVPVFAGTDPRVQQLLITAEQQANLLGGQAGPFQLEVDFAVVMGKAVPGHLELKWEAKDRWWRRVEMNGFRQTEIRLGDKIYTARNADFTPAGVKELLNLLGFAEEKVDRGAMTVQEQSKRRENGESAECLKGELTRFNNEQHEVCVSRDGHEILSDDWKESGDQRRREAFAGYMAFGQYRFPSRLELELNGRKIVTASVTSLAATAFDESLLAPLQQHESVPEIQEAPPDSLTATKN